MQLITKTKNKMKVTLKLMIIFFAIVSTGCGNENKTEKKLGEDAPQRTIVVEANDEIKFNVTEIRVKSGERITLTLNHVGKMLKLSMGHNLVILKQGTDVEQFALDAISAAANDYIPNDGKDVIATTIMLGGGESDTITFDAPAKGTYDFICSFPGHWGTMKGKFIVE